MTNQLDLITFNLVWKLTMLIDMCSQKIVPFLEDLMSLTSGLFASKLMF
jgi:hypothetical protein